MDIGHLSKWIGSEHEARDTITPRLANSLAAVLDERCNLAAGDPAPLGIHWCLSPEIASMAMLGADGHPARGGFLPPVPLPRRMWAGGELVVHGQLLVGDEVVRNSRVEDVKVKTGRTGTLCFVTVRHQYETPNGMALTERQDIVYRETRGLAEAPHTAPHQADLVDEIEATPALLMRYSAATFNGHRIHYDRDYSRNEELYPGLVVHGPLQATYLLRLSCQMNQGRPPRRIGFRSTAPLFDGNTLRINGRRVSDGQELWVADNTGVVTMRARTEQGK